MTDREAFEQWAGDGFAGTLVRDLEGEYRNHFIQWQWEGWQAALAYRSEQASQGQVPEGWQIVPKNPTEEMIVAGHQRANISMNKSLFSYRAMLAAAPKDPKQ